MHEQKCGLILTSLEMHSFQKMIVHAGLAFDKLNVEYRLKPDADIAVLSDVLGQKKTYLSSRIWTDERIVNREGEAVVGREFS